MFGIAHLFVLGTLTLGLTQPPGLPADFVYLRQVAPGIEQDMRYATAHNFTGGPVPGYAAGECIVTRAAAQALAAAQTELNSFGLGLKVYDCYRPLRAVRHFAAWAADGRPSPMAAEFFPRTPKDMLHQQGYIAHRSGHSRGSTVDVTLVPYPAVPQATYRPGQPLKACTLPAPARFADNSLDMGTGFDCLDVLAHTQDPRVSQEGRKNRLLLRQVMRRYGLINYAKEWWHHTYFNEPYKNQMFDAQVTAAPGAQAP